MDGLNAENCRNPIDFFARDIQRCTTQEDRTPERPSSNARGLWQTGLHLLPARGETGNHRSNIIYVNSVDHVEYGHMEQVERLSKNSEVLTVEAEIKRVKEENQKLSSQLKELTTNYGNLQMHFTSLVQKRKRPAATAQNQIVKINYEECPRIKGEGAGMPANIHAAQFVDNLSWSSFDSCQQSLDSSGGRARHDNDKKSSKLMDNQALPSKERKIVISASD